MEYGAIDLHVRRSHFQIVDEAGGVVAAGKIETTRADLTRIFGARPAMRVLVEASTDSEWVAQHLEALGHQVVVADPNYAPMYGSRQRRIKTDRRDRAALAEANRLGLYRRAHRVSGAQRARRQQLRIRRQLVQIRSKAACLLRSIVRQDGWRIPAGPVETILRRLAGLALPEGLRATVAPLQHLLAQLNEQVATANTVVDTTADRDATAQQLMTAPGIGPVSALTFAAVLDTPARFDGHAGRASAFVGLVPSEHSSGEQHRKGHITKTGSTELRALLVQASWGIWRGRSPAGAALRRWAQALAARRGRRIAIVALARRLCRIVFAMWRDQRPFQVERTQAA